MEKILVTVYVLTYNKFDYIYRNLRSVLDQDYPNIELLVSDDGSSNFPQNEIDSFLDRCCKDNIRLKSVIANKKNVGTVKHINSILPLAHGELLIPLSGDDEFFDNHVVSRIVGEYERSHFNILSTSRVAVDENGHPLYYIPHYLDRVVINYGMKTARQQLQRFVQNRFHNFASGSTMVIRADFIRKMGGHDERYKLWEDGPFIAKVTSLGYSINHRFDIISIKYHLGGISTGGAKGEVRSAIKSDVKLFKSTKQAFPLSRLSQKFLRYETASCDNATLFRLKFFEVLVYIKLSQLFEFLASRLDKWIVSKHPIR